MRTVFSCMDMVKNIRSAVPLIMLVFSLPVYSETSGRNERDDLYDMSLEELMDIEVTVASNVPVPQRKSPGVISVITSEEIQKSGASDLEGVLRLVPSFEFLVDVTGATGISFRGNLGYIGRVLIMIDGQELNELLYACTFTGNHYPVNSIKRIEIMRGPGSSIYGGFAELGVINIITKSGTDIKGLELGIDYGQMSETFSHKNMLLSMGSGNSDYDIVIHAFYGQGNRSERDNMDIYGNSFNMAGQSDINPFLINARGKFKELSARIIFDKYVTTSREYFGINLSDDYQIDYTSILGELKYDWRVNRNLTITPRFNIVNSTPWHSVDDPLDPDAESYMHFDKSVFRRKINLTGSYDTDGRVYMAGIEYWQDKAKHTEGFTHSTFWTGLSEIQYTNLSCFSQAMLKSELANFTAGLRYDKHSQYGAAFAPRVSVTRIFNKLHMKLLFGSAFRTPSIDEIDLNYYLPPAKSEPEITPERAKIHEIEIGYMFNSEMTIICNFYRSRIDNTILFTYSSEGGEGGEGYDNSGTSGSNGLELEARLRKDWGYLTANYSYYTTSSSLRGVPYYLPGDRIGPLLGSAQHKLSLYGSYNLSTGLTLNPSLNYLSERYAYTHLDETSGEMTLSTLDPIILANLYVQYKDSFSKGLTLGIGVYNILDVEYKFIQAYNGAHPPLPGQSRRLVAKLSYNLNLVKMKP